MKKILVTGSIAYDVLLNYDGSFTDAIDPKDLEHLSVSFFSPHYAKHHGGTGANIAWNLRLLGTDPLLIGTVGHDGGSYIALLEERGIDTKQIEVLKDHVTATAIIGTDTAERQIAFFHPGADAHGHWPDLQDDRDDLSYAVVGPRNAKLMLQAMRWCRDAKVPCLFDPGQLVIGLSKDELLSSIRGSAGVIANAYEWSLLSEKIGASVDGVLKMAPFLIVTHGEAGLTIFAKKSATAVRACRPDHLVNPTGAGDALRAGLLTGLSAGWELPTAAMLGASLASFVVEQEGPLIDHVDIEEILQRAEATYGKALPAPPYI
ncbi:hypothetical protein HYZ99_00710 [Candidatus Peregrinibacteria bacterium]|nr:hypothetical protein [Candidatus Peregrinibacteria bacterium]